MGGLKGATSLDIAHLESAHNWQESQRASAAPRCVADDGSAEVPPR